MEQVEQVFFNVPLSKLEPIFKRWVREAQAEFQPIQAESTEADRWFDLIELCEYHPDKPTKPTVYGWVSTGKIPVHKGGKKLRFLKSEIDNWLKQGKIKTFAEIEADAEQYLTNRKRG